jgi:membrane-bound lytic murein transglycosylase D
MPVRQYTDRMPPWPKPPAPIRRPGTAAILRRLDLSKRFGGLPDPFDTIWSRIGRTAHPVRVLVAAVVLGVMNQACAVNGSGRQPVSPTRPAQAGKPAPAQKGAPAQSQATARGIQLRLSTEPATAVPPAVPAAALPPATDGATAGSPQAVAQGPETRLAASHEPPAAPALASHAVALAQPPAIPAAGAGRPAPPAAPRIIPPVPPAAAVTTGPQRPAPVNRQATASWTARTAGSPAEPPNPPPAQPPAATAGAATTATATQPPAPIRADASPATTPMPAAAPTAGAQRLATPPVAVTPLATPSAEESLARAEKVDSLWARVRSGFGVPDLQSPLVDRHEAFYANRPQYLQRIVERGKRYLHFIVEEVEKRGMPLEIALLPMIESAYNPKAYSKAHASGMWQFIPSTGKNYGLEQNWWYDGRRDVLAATRAALDYLQKLHADFGDWQLALAAYNWGEGAVARAIERNQRRGLPTDYSNLNMPAETRNYLPKLQAVKNIVSEPERFGMALDEVPNEPYFIRVAAPGHIDFKRAAQLAEVPLEELHSLNPGHNRPVIATDQSLLIPADKADVFEQNLRALEGPLTSWRTYRLPAAERLDAIAARFHTSVALLAQVNDIRPGTRLKAGSTLLVPAGATRGTTWMTADAGIDTTGFNPPQALAEQRIHRVRKGETLAGIAARHDVEVDDLMAWNRLSRPAARPGAVLRLHPPASGGGGARHLRHDARQAPAKAHTGSHAGAKHPDRHRSAKGGHTPSGTRAAKKPATRKEQHRIAGR